MTDPTPTRRDRVAAVARLAAGPAAIGLIVVGVGALAGWPWALIAAGIPVAAFYVAGEVLTVVQAFRTRRPD